MFVLSPSVEQTTTSARSMPASVRASTSSAVPTVNCPPSVLPRLVEVVLEQGVRLRALVQDAHLVALP